MLIGNRHLLETNGIVISPAWDAACKAILQTGASPLWVVAGDQVVSLAAIDDDVRPGASSTVADLQRAGWKVCLLSGDHPKLVEKIGRSLGIAPECIWGGVSPEGKLSKILELKASGRALLMVGDGVNDAAALKAADVGISVQGAAEVSLEVADVYLSNGDLNGIPFILKSAGRTMWIIRRNAVVSLAYNAFSIGLASVGWLHPLTAAILMPVSSISVIAVTLVGTFKNVRRPTAHER
jgi:Cu2+-exporting ATPase